MDMKQWKWIRKPKDYLIEEDRIEIVTKPCTDLWQRTYYHFQNDNAPVLQIETDEQYFSFIVKTEFKESHHRFDQCGIVMYLDSENWLKASIEYENEEYQHLGSVVTNHGYSDWATTEISSSIKSMWYRLSRREDDYCIECSTDGKKFSQMRICHMHKGSGTIQFGIYACSPEDSSFKAVFSHMQIMECQWEAHNGQKPDKKVKTLYVSDLDGSLLRSDETISEYTIQVINELVEKGMNFSYATARSYHTAHKVTQGLDAKIPLITYNGTMIKDNVTGEILVSNFFDTNIYQFIDDLIHYDIYPIVYSLIDNEEKFSYIEEKCSQGALDFIYSRKGDIRDHKVDCIQDLYKGHIFYITCIDKEEKLEPIYKKYKHQYHSIFQKDFYSKEQWLEFLPQNASKSNAIQQLKEYLQCEKVVAFGDGKNDIDMFEKADECYAVENAVDELKDIATGIIGHHNDDAVAKWLKENFKGS